MKLTYDPKQNIAYIRFRDDIIEAETIRLSDDLLVDIAPDGRLYGIELLNANELLSGIGKKLVVENTATGETNSIVIPA